MAQSWTLLRRSHCRVHPFQNELHDSHTFGKKNPLAPSLIIIDGSIYLSYLSISPKQYAKIIGWPFSASVMFAVVYGLYPGSISVSLSSVYASLAHTAWAIALAFIVVQCCTGSAPIVDSLLSVRLMYPLSRLTYCAYLVHPVIMVITTAQMDGPLHLHNGIVVSWGSERAVEKPLWIHDLATVFWDLCFTFLLDPTATQLTQFSYPEYFFLEELDFAIKVRSGWYIKLGVWNGVAKNSGEYQPLRFPRNSRWLASADFMDAWRNFSGQPVRGYRSHRMSELIKWCDVLFVISVDRLLWKPRRVVSPVFLHLYRARSSGR